MSFNIQVRKKQLQSLDQYISSSKDKVQSILDYLGWNPKKVEEADDMLNCPFNTAHKIQVVKIQKHVENCCVLTSGYSLDDVFLSEPQHNPKSSISLDNSKKIEILNEARKSNSKFKPGWNGLDPDPMTSDRLISTFSTDERLAIYNYCVQNTEGPPEPNEFNINMNDTEKKDSKTLTEEDRRQQERNAKRRRIKYKSVHTGRNKSRTEVMRELIANQMEMYQEYLKNKQKAEAELARQLEMQDVDEQFDQPDASNLIYDFDNDLTSSVDPTREFVPNITNSENYSTIPCLETFDSTDLHNFAMETSNLETRNHTLESSYIDNTSYDYQEYISNILAKPHDEYDKKIKEYSQKVNQLRILKERDRKRDHFDKDHHESKSRSARSSHREKDRRHSHRDYRNGHNRRYSRDRRESHHRSERRH
nr:U11/U12 small nuclear ribonucleoprotein 48 kDa protein-like [Leptinotarsa decemlineata]